MSGDLPRQGLLDTNILILRRWIYGRVSAVVIAAGRKLRGSLADLMIAVTAIAESLPLFTTNPADFAGLDTLARIIPRHPPGCPARPAARPLRVG